MSRSPLQQSLPTDPAERRLIKRQLIAFIGLPVLVLITMLLLLLSHALS